MVFGFRHTTYHLENAEMTIELRDDLMNFSLTNLHNALKNHQTQHLDTNYNTFHFVPPFLECLKQLVCRHFHSCVLSIYILYDTAII